ncbi:DUF6531 domain-containing protein [Natrarchaeobius oligotrophus]|uniref:RHS repeat protein n=1 Tax=Natrarchaeobius chitinivorans TaxID=1679083 RepID=A0A3N6MGX5_NATCH|nr:DUF6531 domain-containing protein [Natrarchaeobius chitinivorans]RQH03259.1 hypothetical protein EA472_01365 [Natrarchaeobius chitinivorans]
MSSGYHYSPEDGTFYELDEDGEKGEEVDPEEAAPYLLWSYLQGEMLVDGEPMGPQDERGRLFARVIVYKFLVSAAEALEQGQFTEDEMYRWIREQLGEHDLIIQHVVEIDRSVGTEFADNVWPGKADRVRELLSTEEGEGYGWQVADQAEEATEAMRSEQGVGPVDGDDGELDEHASDSESASTAIGADESEDEPAPDSDGQGTASTERSKTGGDPLLLASGQFFHRVTDLELAGRGLALSFTRTYLSGATYDGPLGHNWDHNYNLWLREERELDDDGNWRNVVYRSTGTLREDPYVQRIDEPSGDLPPLEEWQDATFDPPDGYFDRLEKRGGTYVLETVEGLRYYYNEDRYADRIVDPNGNELTFEYDAAGRLERVVDPVGKSLRFQYDERARIRWLIDEVGERRVHFAYTDNGDLEEVDLHLGDRVSTTDYRYSGPDRPPQLQHNLEEIVNARGRTVVENRYGQQPGTWGYNRVVGQFANGGEYEYEYGIVEEHEVDPAEDPVNVPRRWTRVTYPNGHDVVHEFNRQGNVVRRRERAVESSDLEVLESTYRYDEDARRIAETLADGRRTEYVYERERYADVHGGSTDGATPGEQLAFGNLLRVVRHPRPDVDENRRIVTTYEYADRTQVSGRRVSAVRGPYYATLEGNELPDQRVGTTSYEYDDSGNLSSIVLPDVERPDGSEISPQPIEFDYDDGRLVDLHQGGVHVRFDYFDDELRSGFVSRIVHDPDGIGLETTFQVDELGRKTRTVGPYGATIDRSFTPFDTPERITGPVIGKTDERATVEYEYDDQRRLVRIVEQLLDADGERHPNGPLVRTFDHDAYGRLTEETRGTGEDERRDVRTRSFGPSGRLRRERDWRGTDTAYEYDARLRKTATVRAADTPSESVRTVRYNSAGDPLERTDGRGATTAYEYDAFGRRAVVRDPDGNERRVAAFDAAGHVLDERLVGSSPDGDGPIRWTRDTYEYDALGRLVERHRHLFVPGDDAADDRSLSTARFYDDRGRLQRTVDPTGAERTFDYDALGRRIELRDADGTVTTRDIDDANRRLETTVERTGSANDGSAVTRVARTRIRFDDQGRPIERTDEAGNSRSVAYDSRGETVLEVDEAGTERTIERDAFGRIVAAEIDDVRTVYERDPAGAIVGVVDPLGNRTDVERDALGRRTAVERGDDRRELEYDGEGLPVRETDENGVVFHREYTPGGDLETERPDLEGFEPPSDDPGYEPETVGETEFTYTPHGALERASNDVATVTRTYDSLGRLRSEEVDGRRVEMAYDDADRLSALTYPGGRRIEYGYSPAGVLESVEQTAAGSAYPGDGTRQSIRSLLSANHVGGWVETLALDGVDVDVTHNSRGLPVGADWTIDDDAILRERRLFGPRRECTVEQFDGRLRLSSFDGRRRQTATSEYADVELVDVSSLESASDPADLDGDGQELESDLEPAPSGLPDHLLEYDLDDNTNRKSVSTTSAGSSETTNYDVGPYNRYDHVGSANVTYDRTGNLLGDSAMEYTYDARGRLAAVTASGETTTFEYGPLGRMLAWNEPGRDRRLVYAGERTLGWHAPGTLDPETHVVPGRSGPCQVSTGDRDYVPVSDLGGTVLGWVDVTGSDDGLSARRTYDPFGSVREQDGAWPAPLGFRGYLETTDGLYVLPSRVLHPELGRFLQRDPAGFADGTNQYAYARHAPMAMTDVWGYKSSEDHWSTPADDAADAERGDGFLSDDVVSSRTGAGVGEVDPGPSIDVGADGTDGQFGPDRWFSSTEATLSADLAANTGRGVYNTATFRGRYADQLEGLATEQRRLWSGGRFSTGESLYLSMRRNNIKADIRARSPQPARASAELFDEVLSSNAKIRRAGHDPNTFQGRRQWYVDERGLGRAQATHRVGLSSATMNQTLVSRAMADSRVRFAGGALSVGGAGWGVHETWSTPVERRGEVGGAHIGGLAGGWIGGKAAGALVGVAIGAGVLTGGVGVVVGFGIIGAGAVGGGIAGHEAGGALGRQYDEWMW